MTRKIILIFMLFFGVTNLLLNTNIYLKKNLNIDPEKKTVEINSNLISENSIGILSIPEIDIYLPIYNYKDVYTSMEKGIAYDTNTGVPGGKKEIVLMGHREQELYKLKNIKKNEKIYLLFSGEIYTYQVTDFEEIKESDYKTVYGNSSEEELRIFTCYPLRKYSVIEGRFLVKAKKISDMNYDVKIT